MTESKVMKHSVIYESTRIFGEDLINIYTNRVKTDVCCSSIRRKNVPQAKSINVVVLYIAA